MAGYWDELVLQHILEAARERERLWQGGQQNAQLMTAAGLANLESRDRAALQGQQIAGQQQLAGMNNMAALQRLREGVAGDRAMQGDRLGADATRQYWTNQNAMQNTRLQDQLLRGQSSDDFKRLLQELEVRQGYTSQNAAQGYQHEMDLQRLQDELARQRLGMTQEHDLSRMGFGAQLNESAAGNEFERRKQLQDMAARSNVDQFRMGFQADLAKLGLDAQLREQIAQKAFERQLQAGNIDWQRQLSAEDRTRGYSQQDRELQWLEGNDAQLKAELGTVHQLYGKMDPAGQQVYRDLSSQIQKLDEAYFKHRKFSPQEYFRARQAIGSQFRAVPWQQYLTTKPGEFQRRGIYEGVIKPDMTWEKLGVAHDATPEDVKRHVETFSGIMEKGGVVAPWVLDPVKGTIDFNFPSGYGARGGAPRQLTTADYQKAKETILQRKMMAAAQSGQDISPDQITATPQEILAELQQQMATMAAAQQSLDGQQVGAPGILPQVGGSLSMPAGVMPGQSQMGQPNLGQQPATDNLAPIRSFQGNISDPNAAQMFLSQLLSAFPDPSQVEVESLPPDIQQKYWQAIQVLRQFRMQGRKSLQPMGVPRSAPQASPDKSYHLSK